LRRFGKERKPILGGEETGVERNFLHGGKSNEFREQGGLEN